MANTSNLFTATVTETEGTGCPNWLHATGRGVGISTSPSEAMAIARRKAHADMSAKWDEIGNPYGGCPVLSEVTLRKGGRLIVDRF